MASALAFLFGAVSSADASAYIFPGPFGTAAADRYLVACITYRSGSTINITGVTIGGVAASLVVSANGGTAPAVTVEAMYIANVPAGTSGDVGVTLNGTAVRCGCKLYSLTGIASPTPIATASMITNTGTFAPFTLPVPAHAIASGYNGNGGSRASSASQNLAAGSPSIAITGASSTNTAWSVLTEDYDVEMEAVNTTRSAYVMAAWALVAAGTAITPANSTHAHSGTSPALALAAIAISPSNSLHGQSAGGPALVFVPLVAVGNASHGHSASSPSIAAKSTVEVGSTTHGHSATAAALSTSGLVAVTSAIHGHAATSASLTAPTPVVTVGNASHGHTSTSPAVTARGTVAGNDNHHGHTATPANLQWSGAVGADPAAHSHTATSPAIHLGGVPPSPVRTIRSVQVGRAITSPSVSRDASSPHRPRTAASAQ